MDGIIPPYRLHLGDCLDILPTIASETVDAVITDPPYAEIDRPYGRLTEDQWHELMDQVVAECRRILKPTGSLVLVLQANQSRVGSTRPWLFEFIARWCRAWNLVQDAYWWNHAAMPTVHCHRDKGLMRPSVKHLVWLGPPDCYRCQDEVLWTPSQAILARDKEDMALRRRPSGQSVRPGRTKLAVMERGGSTPFNLLPISNCDSTSSAGAHGHGAGTPRALCDWWIKYICPAGGTVLDPFHGSGSVGLSALSLGRSVIGIERDPGYHEVASRRLAEAVSRPEGRSISPAAKGPSEGT